MKFLCCVYLPALKRGNFFWPVSILFLIIALPIAFILPPAEPTLWANSHHNSLFDFFFKWITKIAEWPVVVVAVILAFLQHWRTGLLVALCYGAEAMIVVIIKNILNEPRPSVETGISALHQVDGVIIHSYHSFPSGHTAAAFVGFGFISFMIKDKRLQIICAFSAALIAYSRMYLGQHYLRDLIAGETIALIVLFVFFLFHNKLQLKISGQIE